MNPHLKPQPPTTLLLASQLTSAYVAKLASLLPPNKGFEDRQCQLILGAPPQQHQLRLEAPTQQYQLILGTPSSYVPLPQIPTYPFLGLVLFTTDPTY